MNKLSRLWFFWRCPPSPLHCHCMLVHDVPCNLLDLLDRKMIGVINWICRGGNGSFKHSWPKFLQNNSVILNYQPGLAGSHCYKVWTNSLVLRCSVGLARLFFNTSKLLCMFSAVEFSLIWNMLLWQQKKPLKISGWIQSYLHKILLVFEQEVLE